MTARQDELLSRIYRLADTRIQAAGSEMPCSEALFRAMAAQTPGIFDYSLVSGLCNEDFLAAAFLGLLERPLDDNTKTAWQDRCREMPAETFQTAALRSVLHSAEYRQHQVKLTGCPLPVTDRGQSVSVQISGQQMPDKLVRMYRRLPRPMQKLAKKIAGKGDAE